MENSVPSQPVLAITPQNPSATSPTQLDDLLCSITQSSTDADGDPITWAIVEGPPGVSIDKRGRVRVKRVDLAEAFDGEVSFETEAGKGSVFHFDLPIKQTQPANIIPIAS